MLKKKLYLNDMVCYNMDGMNCVDYIVKIIKVWIDKNNDGCMLDCKSCETKYVDSILYLSCGDIVRINDIDDVIPRRYKNSHR